MTTRRSSATGSSSLSALDAPTDLLDSDDPLAEAVRAEIPIMAPGQPALLEVGWRVLTRDDSGALVAGGDPLSSFLQLTQSGGRWHFAGSGSGEACVPRRIAPEGVEPVRWLLDPAHLEPGPDATELHVHVSPTRCSGGEPLGGRLIGPQVEMTDDEVVVALAAVPLPPGAYTCPTSPPDAVVVTLAEPVGDRTIVDAFDLPPRPPVVMGDPLLG